MKRGACMKPAWGFLGLSARRPAHLEKRDAMGIYGKQQKSYFSDTHILFHRDLKIKMMWCLGGNLPHKWANLSYTILHVVRF